MRERGGSDWISAHMAIALVVVSVLAMTAFTALSAYAPQFRTETAGRPNVLSKSAIGFAGLKLVLEETSTSVWVSRNRARTADDEGLLILTPEAGNSGQSVAALATGGKPVLIVLPKWPTLPDYLHAGWVRKLWPVNPELVAQVLKGLDKSTTVMRPGEPQSKNGKHETFKPQQAKPLAISIAGSSGFGSSYPARLTIDGFQAITGKNWVPELTDGNGHTVLARLKGTKTYVLSDPDLVNTAALKDEGVARGAVALIHQLPGSEVYVGFDVTLAGFDVPKSLLRSLFGPPFLAVTLLAILTAALMAVHAVNRFGSPREEELSFAFGKRSLADNTAGLIRVMGRGPEMAPRYAAAIRRLAARALRGGRAEDAQWLDAVERAGHIAPTYNELLIEAEKVETESALMKLAAKLHEWKSRIIHERH